MISRTGYKHFKQWCYSFVSSPNQSPVFVLGNQKSGTSAISWLMSQASGESMTLDVTRAIADPNWQQKLKEGQLTVSQFSRKYAFEFSRSIIKEPALSLYARQLKEAYPNARFVFIVRDPRDNIRSILNRLNISGEVTGWPDLAHLGEGQAAWDMILRADWLGYVDANDAISSLAYRWEHCCAQYSAIEKDCHLIRYEDFLADKQGTIESLLAALNLNVCYDISASVNTQLQSKGDNSQSWLSFFGKENLERINQITRSRRDSFDYP